VKEESPCGCRANEERKTEKLCYSPVLNIHYFKLLLSSFQDCSRCQGAGFPTFALFLVRKLFLKTSNSNFLWPGYTFCHFAERDANSHTHKTYATRTEAKKVGYVIRSFPGTHREIQRRVLNAA